MNKYESEEVFTAILLGCMVAIFIFGTATVWVMTPVLFALPITVLMLILTLMALHKAFCTLE